MSAAVSGDEKSGDLRGLETPGASRRLVFVENEGAAKAWPIGRLVEARQTTANNENATRREREEVMFQTC